MPTGESDKNTAKKEQGRRRPTNERGNTRHKKIETCASNGNTGEEKITPTKTWCQASERLATVVTFQKFYRGT